MNKVEFGTLKVGEFFIYCGKVFVKTANLFVQPIETEKVLFGANAICVKDLDAPSDFYAPIGKDKYFGDTEKVELYNEDIFGIHDYPIFGNIAPYTEFFIIEGSCTSKEVYIKIDPVWFGEIEFNAIDRTNRKLCYISIGQKVEMCISDTEIE